ncbi:hypothetical protein CCP1ISM_2810001 [Azospirillaceae bacterium]
MVCDNTNIIVICKNIDTLIASNMKILSDYAIEHHNIQKIYFCDINSSDLTAEIINNQILPKTHFIGKFDDEREALNCVLPQLTSDNVIMIEGELYTRLHQIRLQIKKLRKASIILPNRFSKKSKTEWYNNKQMLGVKTDNLTFRMFSGLRFDDLTNTNKAFKRKQVLELLSETLNKEYLWPEMISLALKKGIRVSSIETHYIIKSDNNDDGVIKGIRRGIELLRLKK